MGLENHRHQNPVGQGFFHSAFLLEEDRLRLSYVYDCGAMAKYADARNREIDKYHRVATLYGVEKLDFLFLSHVHADHVNGVERLLGSLDVDTIVMPLLNVKDRLIAYGRTSIEDPASAQSGFYRDLIVDPASALSRFRPRQILFIEPGGEGPFLKGVGGEDGPAWLLVGRGHPRSMEIAADSWTEAVVIPDTMAMMMTASVPSTGSVSSSSGGAWLLAPYVDPMIESQRRRFIAALAKELKTTSKLLEPKLTSTSYVQDLVVNKVNRLAAAYAKLARDLNVTSMSLYSGPARSLAIGEPHELRGSIGGIGWHAGLGSIAWLATGDAALKQIKRRRDYLAHYGRLLAQVATLTLPHHGSEQNFHIALLNAVNPKLCVAAADSYSKWKHPGAHVVQSVCSHPALLQVVTSKQLSSVWERASLG